MNRNGILAIVDEKGREKERYPVVYGAHVLVEDGAPVKSNQILLEWDPYTFSILTEVSGVVHFKDLIEGLTMQEQVDEITGNMQLVVTDSPDEKRLPTIIVRPAGGARHDEKQYLMPTHAHLMVRDGEEVHAGDVLAKIPRETTKTKDITGGLPRVVELFEARKPRETAIIAEINGIVKYGEIAKGQRKIYIIGDDGEQREYSLPRGVHINVQEGERVRAGDPLMDGPRNPHDILARARRKGTAEVPGERNPGSLPSAGREHQRQAPGSHRPPDDALGEGRGHRRHRVPAGRGRRQVQVPRGERSACIEAGGRPATGKPVLLGITKASLSTDSFISAASFQETTRVLTEAAINGKVDYLRGLKENVIMGRLIPAGTGMEYYRQVKIAGEDVVEEPRGRAARSTPSPVTTRRPVCSTPADCPRIRAKNRWPSSSSMQYRKPALALNAGAGFCVLRPSRYAGRMDVTRRPPDVLSWSPEQLICSGGLRSFRGFDAV